MIFEFEYVTMEFLYKVTSEYLSIEFDDSIRNKLVDAINRFIEMLKKNRFDDTLFVYSFEERENIYSIFNKQIDSFIELLNKKILYIYMNKKDLLKIDFDIKKYQKFVYKVNH